MNTALLKTFDPKSVIVTFGTNIITDFADGTFIEITTEENFDVKIGADGSENRVNKNRTGADVKLTLSQTSLSNIALNAQYETDRLTNLGILPLTIIDLSGTTQFFSPMSYIKKRADASFGDTMTNRVWEIRATQVLYNLGGNL